MWIIRFLNGPLAGQVVPLTKNSTLIGRAPGCDIKIPSGSISKEHTRIEIFDDKVIVTDAGSRNGTFINGVQVRSSKANSGDKIALHDVFFEVQKVPENWAARFQQQMYGGQQQPSYGNVAYQQSPPRSRRRDRDDSEEFSAPQAESAELMQSKFPRWAAVFQEYMDRVVLPGMVKLPELFDFKWVLAGFMAAFILLVTTLSTIPLVRILKSSIEEESQHHAMTIATTLARVNRPYLTSDQISAASVDIATARPGVKKAMIISNIDGNIVSPASQAGSYPDIPFVHEARKFNSEAVKQIDDDTVVAMYPVMVFNQDSGNQAVTHWAVVLYDMRSLAVKDGDVLSLFIITLCISLVLGFVLFYFLYKLIEYPIRNINVQLDTALKDGGETVHVEYQFPALQLLASNVSSALTRAANPVQSAGVNRAVEHDRNREIGNLVELMGFAAMGVRTHDLSIAAVNQAFEARIGLPAATLTLQSVNDINDQALKLSLKDLIERVDKNPDELATNELEFSGSNFQVVAQGIYGSAKLAYYLIVLLPMEGEG
ncbi:MAG: FHA domain-containing protein [Bdellovibrionales bacterium]|nr:FHA domain-containing protein [Bdellovibrionales bacterium]